MSDFFQPMPVPCAQLVYKTVGTATLKIHVFQPDGHQATDRRPGIVHFFGGGWNGGSPGQFYRHCQYLASRGMLAMAAEYRVTSVHGSTPFESLSDAKSAMRWVRAHAAELGLDPQRLAAGGGSAGGHLATATALVGSFDEPGDDLSTCPRPNALVLYNPVYFNGPGGCGYERVKCRWQEFSPFHNIAAGAPPSVVFFGTEDHLMPVPRALEFQRLMAAVGTRSELFLYPGQKHAFFNYRADGSPYFLATLYEADRFLTSLGYLSGPPQLPPPTVPVEEHQSTIR